MSISRTLTGGAIAAAMLVPSTVLLGPAALGGTTIHVDDDNCPGPGDGSELNPYCSIQNAIDNAADTDEIVVAPGTYFEAISFLGQAITLRSSDGPDVTTIDGTGFLHVVQCVSGERQDTILDGFMITGGNANGPCCLDDRGGGMLNESSSPTVINCTFVGNHAEEDGGGMYNDGSSPIVTGCTFSGNSAQLNGGGIYVNHGNPILIDCMFSGNWAIEETGDAGGVYNYESSPTLIACTFLSNTVADVAGGMYNDSNSSPTLIACDFISNIAGDDGGGMHNSAASHPNLIDCLFSDNSAGGDGGGGMVNGGSCSPTLTNCTFIGNSATRADGGGMFNAFSCSPRLVNCSFIGNHAEARGGGIFNVIDCNPMVTNCTFSENSAAQGSGLANIRSSPILTNCILWGNSGDEFYNESSSPLVTYCDVQGGYAAVGNIDADPLFVDPAKGDYRLQPGSPCIDAGDNPAVPADALDLDDDGNVIEPIPFDLDGNPRFVDDPDMPDTGNGFPPIVDMGAFEFQGLPCPWDLDGSGGAGITDLLAVLAAWGTNPAGPPDFDGDGVVGITDLLELLANWGPCP